MHIATYIFGAAVALPVLCLAIPSRPVAHSLIRRIESTSSSGSFELKSVMERVINGLQGSTVGTGTAPDNPVMSSGLPVLFIKRDSDTDEVPDAPGRLI